MALITLGELKTLWKKVSDWVDGTDSVSKPNVTVDSSALPTGAATEAKQDTGNSKLDDLIAKDFATADKQDDAKGVLETIAGKDFATSAKQDALIGHVDGLEAATGTTTDAEATDNGSVIGLLKRLRTLLGDAIVTLGSAIGTKARLIAGSDGTNARAIKTATDGTTIVQVADPSTPANKQKVNADGSINIKGIGGITQSPVTGSKTVTTSAAAIFAGASALSGRSGLSITNMSTVIVYLGGAGVTTSNGGPLNPGDVRIYDPIDAGVSVPIYAVAASNAEVRVEEWK